MFQTGLTNRGTTSAEANEDLDVPTTTIKNGEVTTDREDKTNPGAKDAEGHGNNPEQMKERLAMMEQILKEKTTQTLAKSKLVANFQKYKENAKVKTWKQVH